MNVLDLFSGIGGFSLGLERAGMRTVAFCEIEPYCRAVLAKHWPGVPCYTDVRELTAARLAADGIAVDVICGWFPCQDISFAGKGAGLAGERSGLWREYSRLIGELRPSYVIVENVAALLSRGLGTVLGDLAALGYDAEWHCIPASHMGAPHRRDRVWVIAHRDSDSDSESTCTFNAETSRVPRYVADASGERLALGGMLGGIQRQEEPRESRENSAVGGETLADVQHAKDYSAHGEGIRRDESSWGWRTEPDVGRVAHGVPRRVDRLSALGNAVVPQIPEIIGRAIMSQAK